MEPRSSVTKPYDHPRHAFCYNRWQPPIAGEQPMTPIELRQKLHHQLDQLSPEELPMVDDFLCSLELVMPPSEQAQPTDFKAFLADLKQQPLRRADPIRPQAKGKDLLASAGTWQGDDLEVCRQILHETRMPSKF
jgi:hypothetical protein